MDEIVQEFLVECHEGLDQLDRDLVELEQRPGDPDLLASIFRTIHTIKGTSGFLAYEQLEAVTHAGESLLARLRDGHLSVTRATTDVLLRLVDVVRELLRAIEDQGTEATVEVGDLVVQIRAVLDDQRPPLTRPGPAAEHPTVRRGVTEASVRVDVELLDTLMRLVVELAHTRDQIVRQAAAGDVDPDLSGAAQRLDLIVTQLQESVLRTRTQPIDHLWSKLPRVVRALAAQCGKRVGLTTVGGDTELDRSLLEAVKDPLTHLVRNAIDHGLERPAERLSVGKPREGALTLRASRLTDQLVLEVSDDGAGIDATEVAAKALSEGLRTSAQLAAMSRGDVLQLICLPGFSTAATVTRLSGRGVGMDVVRTNLEAIGGTVEIESAVGRGTTCRLRVPLTLATVTTPGPA